MTAKYDERDYTDPRIAEMIEENEKATKELRYRHITDAMIAYAQGKITQAQYEIEVANA